MFPLAWSEDGKWIYAVQGDPQKILMIRVQGIETRTVWTLPKNRYFSSITPDGQRIVYYASEWKSDVWLAENIR